MSGATVHFRPWSLAQSSFSPDDTRSSFAYLGCSSSWGRPPKSVTRRFIGRHCFFLPYISSFRIFLGIRWSSTRCTWPSQLILFDWTNVAMSASPRMDSISWAHLSHHSPFTVRGPQILLTILLSKSLKACSFAVLRVHVSAPYVTTGLMSILYSVVLGTVDRKCDLLSFLRLKYTRFPADIFLVISSSLSHMCSSEIPKPFVWRQSKQHEYETFNTIVFVTLWS